MSTTSHSQLDEHRRKRVRKGTKSCWECKRRKIRCQLSSEDVSVCAGCLTRGTTCLSQEYPEEHDSPSGNQIGERLGRVELLLEKLVEKISQYDEEEQAAKSLQTPESIGPGDVLTPYTSNTSTNDNTPILSLFDNSVIGRRENAFQSPISISSPQVSGTKTASCRPTKIERLRQTLVELLPSQQAVDAIFEASSCWLLMYAFNLSRHKTSTDKDISQDDGDFTLTKFNVSETSKEHPTIIARMLLYIAVCFQQLPYNFDMKLLQFPTSAEARIDRYISTVQTLVTSDDEVVSTIGGLECLVLLGIYHINSGNPRRAWLTFRRALNIAQLMGLHRRDTTIPGGRETWLQIVQADRYLALFLGMPCGSADDTFGPEENFQNPNMSVMERDSLFTRKLCQISGRIVERNSNDSVQAYAATQEIEESLEELAKALPATWWSLPTSIPVGHTRKTTEMFDRGMLQIWFYQLEALLHLPFMLRAANERRFEYSKFCCLKASREMMYRYLALREVDNRSFCCKIVDFGALVASVTLLLGLLEVPQTHESMETKAQKESDRALVRTVMASMQELAMLDRDVVAKECVNVIQTLLSTLSAESPTRTNGGNLRLTIPYFGTINIVRPPSTPAQTPPQENSLNSMQPPPIQPFLSAHTQGNLGWGSLQPPAQNHISGPVVSFTSSQFQAPHAEQQQQQMEDWGLLEADTLFFDGLLNTDLEGNWIF